MPSPLLEVETFLPIPGLIRYMLVVMSTRLSDVGTLRLEGVTTLMLGVYTLTPNPVVVSYMLL